MRRAVVLHRGWSASLCLVVVGVPVFVFLWFSFSPPPVLSEDQGGGMVTSWCNYAICQSQVSKHSAAVELGPRCGWGPWPPGSNEITDLLLPLLLQLLWFPGICCGHACLTVWQAAAGNVHLQAGSRSWPWRPRAGVGTLSPASLFPSQQNLFVSIQGYPNITTAPDYSFFHSKWGEGCLFSSEIKQCLPSNLVMLELQ